MSRDDGLLRACMDGELPPAEHAALSAHVVTCVACQARLKELEAQAAFVSGRLGILALGLDEAVQPAPEILTSLKRELGCQAEFTWRERLDIMVTQLFMGRWRSVLVGFAALVLVAALLTLEPVRVAATQFLGVFRVRKFAVITLDPAQVERLRSLEEKVSSSQGFPFGETKVLKEPGAPRPVASVDEARAELGIPVRLPRTLPADINSTPVLRVQDGGAAQMTVDRARAQALLDALGRSDLKLPAALDGATIEFTIPKSVIAEYGDGPSALHLIQMSSPTVNLPPGVDLAQLGEIGLEVLGLSPDEARRLSGAIDWSSTLVIPLPSEMGSFQEVTVDGVTGILINARPQPTTPKGPVRGGYSLMWAKHGVVYNLTSRGNPTDLLAAANSMQ